MWIYVINLISRFTFTHLVDLKSLIVFYHIITGAFLIKILHVEIYCKMREENG